VSTESYVSKCPDSTNFRPSAQRSSSGASESIHLMHPDQRFRSYSDSSVFLFGKPLSSWSRSGAKRVFDCACVLAMMPVLIPILLAVGLAVRLTSSGPVLFLQKRMGRHGRNFTILKFRTMTHRSDKAHQPVTTSCNQQFTPVGPFLRRWKLDELPQLLNVLAGHMSLVGPRPKLPVHAISNLSCRAGITGAATIAFALEEGILDRVPKHHLESFYHTVVLPAKHKLDADYMANATFLSDLKLLFDSVVRRWDTSIMEDLLNKWALEQGNTMLLSSVPDPEAAFKHAPILPQMDRPAPSGQSTAF
jgi:lipopolysaccharide/colanic/teichoic acid biosynthesis glycosyltransferase